MSSSKSFYVVLIFIFSLSISNRLQAKTREDLPPALPITSQDIRFELVPNEPGPVWNCVHVEVLIYHMTGELNADP